jgi:hypothetical protein
MNYARLHEWVNERVEDLVEMGVPRVSAEEVMHRVELDAVNAECKDRQDRQFLLDFLQVGSRLLAERSGKSVQWVRKRRQSLLNKRNQMAIQR